MTEKPKNIKDMSSEELGLMLAALYEQAFKVQQDITMISAELTERRKQQDEQNKKDKQPCRPRKTKSKSSPRK